MFRQLVDGFLTLIYPPRCVLCRKHSAHTSSFHAELCLECQNTIEFNKPPFCLKCSRYTTNSSSQICSECQQRDYHFDQAWAACLYNDAMQRLLHLYKYGEKTGLRHTFSKYILDSTERYGFPLDTYDLFLPVPLHSVRLRERGYNQSLLLTTKLAESYQRPISYQNLIRVKRTSYQATLKQKERWTNLRDAFRINQPLEFFGKSILIVDDLLTTGATVSEIARLLKEAGAKRVGVITLAIA